MEGKEDHKEIFETLKNVARETPESGDVLAETKASVAAETAKELGEQFLCPVCETLVAADATVCPSCGAEFSEGGTTEYECPVCKASVPAEADRTGNRGRETAHQRRHPGGERPRHRAGCVADRRCSAQLGHRVCRLYRRPNRHGHPRTPSGKRRSRRSSRHAEAFRGRGAPGGRRLRCRLGSVSGGPWDVPPRSEGLSRGPQDR